MSKDGTLKMSPLHVTLKAGVIKSSQLHSRVLANI